jgi:DNA-binding NtrC family response regulator
MVDVAVRALIVDDEDGIRQVVARVLRHAGLEALTAESGERALELLEHEAIDVAIVDIRMPGLTGIDVLLRMKEAGHPAEVVMMTACADISLHKQLVRRGAYALVTKPFGSNDALVVEVLNAATLKRLREQLADRSIARTVTSLALHELAFAEAKKRVVNEFTSAYVRALLAATNNNVSEAARRSGLDRANFRRLLKKPAP